MPLTQLETELRLRARTLIQEGSLPGSVPDRAWGGHGTEQPCSLCGRLITHKELEYEIESDSGGSRHVYRFHFFCNAAWQFECARQEYLDGKARFP